MNYPEKMAAVSGDKDKEILDLRKKNLQLSQDFERITNLLKQSERRRRKQKVVYEKNMENLSIRLADFENNLRREQKEIKEMISKKDKQIKVREELTKTLRQKLQEQHCSQCGYPTSPKPSVELDWQLEIEDEKNEIVKKLPPLDLPPPEETTNIGFTNHRPFRPKSKLSPVAEESESTFASSLRNIHADLNPDRFHAALTASLSQLDEIDDVETPTNSMNDEMSDTKSSSDETPSDQSNEETNKSPNPVEPFEVELAVNQDDQGKNLSPDVLSSFCERLSLSTMKLVNNNLLCDPLSNKTKTPERIDSSSLLQSFCFKLVQGCFVTAKCELGNISVKKKEEIASTNQSLTMKAEDSKQRLRSAAVKVAEGFLSKEFTVKMISEGIKEKCNLQNLQSLVSPDVAIQPDAVSTAITEDKLQVADKRNREGIPQEDCDVSFLNNDPSVRLLNEEKTTKSFHNSISNPIENVEEGKENVPKWKESVADQTESVAKQTKNVVEQTKNVAEQTENVADQTESVAEQTENVADQTESVAEQTENVAKQTESVVEQKKSVAEQKKSVAEQKENNSPALPDVIKSEQQVESPSSKKKKKKKKKKRKSLEIQEDHYEKELATNDQLSASNGCEIIKSPVEDKFSLMLDEQLDVLDELETDDSKTEITRM